MLEDGFAIMRSTKFERKKDIHNWTVIFSRSEEPKGKFFSKVASQQQTLIPLGNIPELRDRFTMRVISGAITLISRGNRLDVED